jgi:predicted nucleic acid-binding protein
MILRYFDSTYLCKLRWPEAGSSEVADCAACADVLICCTLGRAEFYSTGHRKAREGFVTSAQLAVVFEQFNQDCAVGAVRLLPLTSAMFDRVEQIYRNAPTTTYLRASDALHLACAAEHDFTEVYSNDRHFLAAASLFGLRGVNVISGRW